MKKSIRILICLTVLIPGLWYLGFYAPLQQELADIAAQTAAVDAQIAAAAEKAAAMNAMEAELSALSRRPPEIAPYDNLEGVLDQLNTALEGAAEYSLRFSDPVMGADGSVRRSVVLQFQCGSFADAKDILSHLTQGPWLCQVGSLTLRSGSHLLAGPLSASATVTFFESTRLP